MSSRLAGWVLAIAALLLLPVLGPLLLTRLEAAAPVVFQPLSTLKEPALSELSGLAASRRWPGVYWGHNDSGDGPVLYAFNRRGSVLARLPVHGADATDWEDLALFEQDGRSWLAIGDIGDNLAWRSSVTVYLLPEPALDALTAAVARRIDFRYADGPRDAESLAVDAAAGQILLFEKHGERAGFYTLALDPPQGETAVAQRVAELDLKQDRLPALATRHLATAMDLSGDGRWLVVSSYRDVYAWPREAREDWARVLARPARRWPLPRRGGFEALAIEPDFRSVVVAPEGTPTPVFRARYLLDAPGSYSESSRK